MSNSDGVEAGLIGAILRRGDLFKDASELLESKDFHNYNHVQIWEACARLQEHSLGIDQVTVGDEIERAGVKLQDGMWSGRALLSFLRESGEPRNIESYIEDVRDYSIKRQLDPFWSKCAVWSKNGRRAVEIIKDVESELGRISLYSAADEYTAPVSDAVTEAYEMSRRAEDGKTVGIPTGFPDLDKLTGGFLPQNVYLVAARTGIGKTAMLLQMALHAAEQGSNVCVFSLEMSRLQVGQRWVAQKAELNLMSGVIEGKLTSEEWARYTQAVESIAALPLIINDLSGIDIGRIRQTARKLAPDIIFLDYIQLAESTGKRAERRDLDVSAISRGLKYLARELNIPIVAAAQLSRKIEERQDKKPMLSDLRESGSLEQDAYAVYFLSRDEMQPALCTLAIAKHRNGPTGKISLYFKSQNVKFESMEAHGAG